jgi:ATP-grasp domain, R2K clade family 3
MIRFIFPSDYFKTKQVDLGYAQELDYLKKLGFKSSVISLESLPSGTSKIYPIPEPSSTLIYRGWMLTPHEYSLLNDAVIVAGSKMWISLDEYQLSHYLPNWYPLIPDLTPETHFYHASDNLEKQLDKLSWNKFFIKDHVKSLKTSSGSIINKPSEIKHLMAEMNQFRGSIEGGISVRRVEDFIPETEQRYFVINGHCFALSINEEIPSIVYECAQRINSKFFSVDVIDRIDGCKRIVEIGDRQVSGLVGWTVEAFAAIWRNEIYKTALTSTDAHSTIK